MKVAYLSTAATAMILAAGSIWAQNPAPPQDAQFPPLATKASRVAMPPMVSPECNGLENPFFQTVNPLTTNQVVNSARDARAQRAQADEEYTPTIYGFVISASNYTNRGLFQVPMSADAPFVRVNGGAAYQSQVTSATEADGLLYTNSIVDRYGTPYCTYHYVYDINNNYMSMSYYNQGSNFMYAGRDLTTDPITGDIYGCLVKTSACANFVLARVDFGFDNSSRQFNMKREAIRDLDNMFTALFFTADGQLWGIDLVYGHDEDDYDKTVCESSSLYKIDKHTGEMTLVGDTGVKPFYASSACCDLYGNGKVYWTVKDLDNVGSLYTVDLETGAATKLFDFPNNEEFVGLYVPMQASGKAPGTPENLVLDFPEGALNGTVNFHVPELLSDGTAGEGEVTWQVICSGNVIGEGTAEYGEDVDCPASVERAAEWTFAVRLSNEYGKSTRAQATAFLGTGQPAAPTVSGAYSGSHIMIAWEPVTTAYYDRGYINPDEITYTIVRYPDQTVMSTGKKDCFYTEYVGTDPEFGYYKYGVKAVWKDIESPESQTGTFVLGTITPPFTETWDDTSLIGYGDNILTGVYPDYELDGSTLGHWYVHAGDKAATCSTGFGTENAWLLTPGFKFEAGKSYTISFTTYTSYTTTEDKTSRLHVTMGTAQNPDGQTTDIMPEFLVTNLKANPAFKCADFTVPTTGVYYLAFHCCTLNGGAQVYFDNLVVEESPENGIPGPVNSMVVKAESTGSLNTIITANAPAIDNRGEALTGNVTLSLSYDGQVVATQENVAPGAAVTFRHTLLQGGDATFTLTPSNDKGEGRSTSASAYVGFYAPRAVENVALIWNKTDNDFTLSWKAPTQDTKWNSLTADDLRYTVLGVDDKGQTYIVEDGIEGTSITIEDEFVDFDGPQRFLFYGVVAMTNGGTASATVSNIMPVGKPYKAPYMESFSGEPAGIYATTMGSVLGEWHILTDSNIEGITSQDNDDGYLGYYASMWNTQGVFQTGLIDISDLDRPGISFYMYNLYMDGLGFDDNDIVVAINDGDNLFYTIKAEVDQVGNFGKMNSWTKYVVSLESLKGLPNQVYSFAIIPTVRTYVWNFIDNIVIGNLPEVDLAAGPSAGTPLIEEGNTGLYLFNIINNGYSTATDFSVDLLRNDRVVATKAFETLEAGEWLQVSMTDKPDVDAEGEAYYKARVSAADDADTSDNESDPILTNIVLPVWPPVEVLNGSLDENGTILTWTQPDLNYIPWPRTETFETGEAWQQEFTDWTFLDVDNAPVNLGTANGFFGEIVSGKPAGWFVMDVTELDEQRQNSTAFQGHSGVRYLAKVAPGDTSIKGDDWAISPELFGDAQTVSLWAHSHSSTSPENIEILYSMGSTDPADFISAGKWIDIPTGWTEYKANLPEGAKRFAIRAHSAATFILQLDDVTYQPAAVELQLVGYHVWRNGVRVTNAPVTTTSFYDPEGLAGHIYRVTAVYHVGESVPCDEFVIENAALDRLSADGVKISANDGYIIVNGADGKMINIYTVDGRQLSAVRGMTTTAIPAPNGVYMVRVADTVAKIIVK